MTRLFRWIVPVSFLGLFFCLSYGSALRESPVYDEPIHLVSGYSFWKTGHYTMNALHPPLLRLWATLPLVLMRAPWPAQWAAQFDKDPLPLAHIWLFLGPKPVDWYLMPARLMVILLGVGLGALIWRWADQAYGRVAATAALFAYSFCPTVLAYSHYVTTDFAPAAVSTLVLYIFWLHSQRAPTRWGWIVEGALLGAAIATKFTELVMPPIVGIILFVSHRQRLSLASTGYRILGFLGIIGMAYGVTQVGWFFVGLRMLFNIQTLARLPDFFHGYYSEKGWPWFLSALFVIKTPIPFLLLTLAGVFLAFSRYKDHPRVALLWWIFPCLFYLGACSLAQYQMGIRRIMIVYPLLCLWIGWVVSVLWRQHRMARAFCLGMALWYLGAAWQGFPYYISYFNETVEGHGARFAVDCNLDWGQGLKALASYLKNKDIHQIYFSYFGCGEPHAYGFRYVPVACANTITLTGDPTLGLAPEKRLLFVISATNRVGLYYRNHALFQWLDTLAPIDTVGGSLLIYDITGRKDIEKRLLDLYVTPPEMVVKA